MPSSFVINAKYSLVTHYKACRSFLLLSSWTSVAAFILMLACMYPYPVTVMELAIVFLKLLFLADAVVLAMYLFFVTAKPAGKSYIAWLRSKAMAKMTTEDGLVPELFPSLSVSSQMILADSV